MRHRVFNPVCLTFFPVVERCCDKLPGPNRVPGCHPCKSKRNCGTVVLELCGQKTQEKGQWSVWQGHLHLTSSDIRTVYMSLCWDPDILWGLVVLLLLGGHQENLGIEVSLWKLVKSCEVCNHLIFAIQQMVSSAAFKIQDCLFIMYGRFQHDWAPRTPASVSKMYLGKSLLRPPLSP